MQSLQPGVSAPPGAMASGAPSVVAPPSLRPVTPPAAAVSTEHPFREDGKCNLGAFSAPPSDLASSPCSGRAEAAAQEARAAALGGGEMPVLRLSRQGQQAQQAPD